MPTPSKTLLFVDTNIWLDFYRVQGGAGLRLLKSLEAIKDKVIVTYQIESEFKTNRQKVLINSLTNIKAPSGIGLPNIVADTKRTKMLSKGHCQVGRIVPRHPFRGCGGQFPCMPLQLGAVDVLDRDARLLSSRFRLLSRSAKPRRIAIARFGDSANSANGGLLEKDSGRHRGGRETVALGQQT